MRSLVLIAAVSAGCLGAPPDSISANTESMTVCATGAQVEGIDVSYYDGTIDWAAVYGAGKRFAIIRVSDGTGFIDPQFARNWAAARAAGVIRAPYQFFRASQDPTAQANLLLAQVAQA